MFHINFKYCKVFFKSLKNRFVTKLEKKKKKWRKITLTLKLSRLCQNGAGKSNRRSSNKNSNKPKFKNFEPYEKGNTLFFKFEEDVIKGVCCAKDTFVCLVNGRLSQRKMIFNEAVFRHFSIKASVRDCSFLWVNSTLFDYF